MKTRTISLAIAGTGLLAFSLVVLLKPAANSRRLLGIQPGVVPITPVYFHRYSPEGWKACPRCQNATDRAKANAEYKIAGHPNNPKDLSGVWGFTGVGNAFAKAPPMTEWGKTAVRKNDW